MKRIVVLLTVLCIAVGWLPLPAFGSPAPAVSAGCAVVMDADTGALLYARQRTNIYGHLYPSLPVAGEDGTLRSRMRGTKAQYNIHAKTGTLEGVITLAGYATSSEGHELAFAIMNQGVLHAANARRFQDRVCRALTE